ncbi:extracellular solute-binding protein [Paenibacillus urinalis]|uniref:Extracellular solute-binding protein n=1 Tax=Paenibacillus urinalis TaxID=521520 RepID=A0AAX3MWK3_9BACL|nr:MULTISPECIES: extracellular solute-binding protein [Paenibacillus]WDH80797.1 extracellular solute-binding protein [Paenibacillus urinalis]WDH96849.1 extracellular solute-binding protein [Paenibacillus urinalis]WDI00492.1 extracellular solute-binding protein [Paenibacillus urinalis]GAK39165.1 sugar ABC transporter sugar-binding protein [Paenibacillus sp. TCA20]
MKQKQLSKLLALTLAGGLVLSACGGDTSGSSEPSVDADGKANITWLNILHTASPPTETVLNKIEEATNANIEFSWIPDASKEERLNTSLASDSLADIVTITLMENSSVRNALKAGVFWEVGPYLDEFPNLATISEDMRNSASIEGKLYGIPMQKQVARNGVVIRKDWLDKLGLEVPKTTDELMEVAKAFTEQDPDGNGAKDTTGFMDRSDLIYGAFKTLSSYFGTPSVWSVGEDGKVTPEFETEGYVKTMDYMKELYENGYINQDFAVTAKTDQQQNFAQGKAGIYVGALFDSKNLLNMAKGVQDDMELTLVNDITSTGNEADRAIWSISNGVGGLLAFPKSEVKDEAELKRLLQFMDDLMSEEVYTLMTYGIEGTHYTVNEEKAVTITNTELWQQEVQPFASSRPNETGYEIHDNDPLKKESDRLIEENSTFAVLNPLYSLESATFSSQGSELQKTIVDATYKYILGKINLDQFNEAVSSWRKAGGDQIITEYEAAYQAVHGQ